MWLKLRGGSGGAPWTQAGRQAQSVEKDSKSYFPISLQLPGASACGSRPGVLGSAGRAPSPARPQAESPAARALLTARRAATVRPGKSGERLQRQNFPGQEDRRQVAAGSRSRLLQILPPPEAAAAAVKKKRRRREGGRALPLAAWLLTGEREPRGCRAPPPPLSGGGQSSSRGGGHPPPAEQAGALPAYHQEASSSAGSEDRCARELRGDRDFSKPGGARGRTSKSAGDNPAIPGPSW